MYVKCSGVSLQLHTISHVTVVGGIHKKVYRCSGCELKTNAYLNNLLFTDVLYMSVGKCVELQGLGMVGQLRGNEFSKHNLRVAQFTHINR